MKESNQWYIQRGDKTFIYVPTLERCTEDHRLSGQVKGMQLWACVDEAGILTANRYTEHQLIHHLGCSKLTGSLETVG